MTIAKSHQRSWLEISFCRSNRRRQRAAGSGSDSFRGRGRGKSCGGGRLGKANNLSTIPLTLLVLIVVEIVVIFSWFHDDTASSSSSSFFEMNFGGRSAVRRRSRGDDSERERRRFELLRQQQQHQHHYSNNGKHGDAVREDEDDYNVTDQIRRYSVSRPYQPFPSLFRSEKHGNAIVTDGFSSSKRRYVRERYGTNFTIKILQRRGIIEAFDANNTADTEDDYAHESTAPLPWWQVVDNFYEWKSSVVQNYTHEHRMKTAAEVKPGAVDFTPNIRPIILGLDRCEAYRASVPLNERAVGPAGLFSSGTNLLADLMRKNCQPPVPKRFLVRWASWQVPWGKHNPESARLNHAVENRETVNQTAVLPVILIRHPFSWLQAMCKHSYSVYWKRRKEICESNVMLKNPAVVKFGFLKKNQTIAYESVLHLYRDWYKSYFESTDYPLLMARIEDLVYQPQDAVTAICNCAGGIIAQNFTHLNDSANHGDGHGKYRSNDLLAAFVKHGRPLHHYKSMFSKSDKTIMKRVFELYPDIFSAFRYSLPLE